MLSKYFFIFTFSRLYQTERWDHTSNTGLVELKSKRQNQYLYNNLGHVSKFCFQN